MFRTENQTVPSTLYLLVSTRWVVIMLDATMGGWIILLLLVVRQCWGIRVAQIRSNLCSNLRLILRQIMLSIGILSFRTLTLISSKSAASYSNLQSKQSVKSEIMQEQPSDQQEHYSQQCQESLLSIHLFPRLIFQGCSLKIPKKLTHLQLPPPLIQIPMPVGSQLQQKHSHVKSVSMLMRAI